MILYIFSYAGVPVNPEDIQNSHIPFIRKLCSHKSEQEIREAEENFRAFLQLINRISIRLSEEKMNNNND